MKAYRKEITIGAYANNEFVVNALVERYDLNLSADKAKALLFCPPSSYPLSNGFFRLEKAMPITLQQLVQILPNASQVSGVLFLS